MASYNKEHFYSLSRAILSDKPEQKSVIELICLCCARNLLVLHTFQK